MPTFPTYFFMYFCVIARARSATPSDACRRNSASGGTLEIVSAREHVERAVAHYVEVYSASWKNEEPYPRFVPGLIGFLADTGSLRLGLAYLDGQPIAAQLWAVRCGRAAIINLAHRKDCADFAPGTLLTALLMEHVIDVDRVSEVDYLIGDDPYKRNWMSHRRERWGIVAYNPRTAVGLALLVRESCYQDCTTPDAVSVFPVPPTDPVSEEAMNAYCSNPAASPGWDYATVRPACAK